MTWTQAYLVSIPAIWVAGVFTIAIVRNNARTRRDAEREDQL